MFSKNNGLFYLFSHNEAKIAKLYTIYALIFPEQKKLWQGLAEEEIKHAAILQDLDSRYKGNSKAYSVIDNSQKILDYVGDFIDERLVEARIGKLTVRRALEMAMRLELSMIEKKNFDIFSSTEEEIKLALKKLNQETKEHARRLQRYINLAGYSSSEDND